MATNATTARREEWERAFTKLADLNQKLAECQPEERDEIERAIAEQEEDVLDTSAPCLTALLVKLELLFNGQLEGLHPDAEYRRLLIEDLSDLIEESRELIGTYA